MIGRALREAPEACELGEGGVGVLEPELQHLFEGRREVFGVECFEGPLLAGCGHGCAAGVGGVEVGDAVGVGFGLTEDGPGLVLKDGLAEAHLGEHGGHAVGALGVGDPPSAPAHDLEWCAGECGAASDELFFALYELQVVAPAAARSVYGAGSLECAAQVAGSLGRGAGGADESQLLGSLYRAVASGAHRVAGPAEAVGFYGREP